MAEKRGNLIVVSGFSGSGKGTIMKKLTEAYDCYALSVSATTRQPREGEEEGVSYFFVTTDRFEEMIRNGELYEYARYVDHYYGTPRAYVDKKRDEGKDVILEIEVQGAMKIRKKFPESILVFVTPPSAEILKKRLTGRGTESEEVVADRLRRAAEEAAYMDSYDYILVNDDLDTAVTELHGILRAEHDRTDACEDLIRSIKGELADLNS